MTEILDNPATALPDMSERTTTANPLKPQTGDEYLESLRDDREICIYGERVKDVTTHPAFRNSVRMAARLYDALHDPATRRRSSRSPTDTGNGGYTHPFFTAPRSPCEDLKAAAHGDRRPGRGCPTAGWAAAPDYKAAFLGTLGANADFYEPFTDNALRWYSESQEKVLYWNHAIINPPVDRHRAAGRGRRRVHARGEGDRRRPRSSAAPRSSRPARRSPTTTSSPTTACRSRRRSSRWSARSRWTRRA